LPVRAPFTRRLRLGSDRYEDTHNYRGAVEGGAIRFTLVTDSKVSKHTPVHFVAGWVRDK